MTTPKLAAMVCKARGHDLSSRFSYRRTANGARWCIACELLRRPARPKRPRQTRKARTRINGKRRDSRYRMWAQMSAVAASVRIQKQQAAA